MMDRQQHQDSSTGFFFLFFVVVPHDKIMWVLWSCIGCSLSVSETKYLGHYLSDFFSTLGNGTSHSSFLTFSKVYWFVRGVHHHILFFVLNFLPLMWKKEKQGHIFSTPCPITTLHHLQWQYWFIVSLSRHFFTLQLLMQGTCCATMLFGFGLQSLFLQVIGCHCFQIAKQATAQTDKLLHLMNVIHHFYCHHVLASLCSFVHLWPSVQNSTITKLQQTGEIWGWLHWDNCLIIQSNDWQKINWKPSLSWENI